MQPEDFDDFLGQQHLLDHNKPLRRLIEEDKIVSVIFYGPPGTGKTALAHIIARRTKARFIAINAVTAMAELTTSPCAAMPTFASACSCWADVAAELLVTKITRRPLRRRAR